MPVHKKCLRLSALLTFCLSCFAWSADFTWTGNGDAVSWNNPANWNPNTGFPGAGDNAIFNGPGTVELDTAIPGGFAEARILGGRVNLNHLANNTAGATFVVMNNGTLGVRTSGASSGLGAAELTLMGGDLEFMAGGVTLVDGLDETIFDEVAGNAQANIEGYRGRMVSAADGTGILTGHIDYPNDASFTTRAATLGALGFDEGAFAALWTTTFTPTEDGVWGFRFSGSDDNVSMWIDTDQNGTLELANRFHFNGCCPPSGDQFTPAVTSGQPYLLGIVMSDTGGGGRLNNVEFKSPSGAWTALDPSANPGLFQVSGIAPGNLSNNINLNVSSSILLGTALRSVSLGALSFGTSATLHVDSIDLRQSLNFAGPVTLNGDAQFSQTGRAMVELQDVGELIPSDLVQNGDGVLILSTDNSYDGLTLVLGGALEIRADGALGTANDITIVEDGGSLRVAGAFNYTELEELEITGKGNADSPAAFFNSGTTAWPSPILLEGDARIHNLGGNLRLLQRIDMGNNNLELFCNANELQIPNTGGIVGGGDILTGGTNGRIVLLFNNTMNNSFSGDLTVSNIIWDARSADALGTTNGITRVVDGGRLELRDGRTWGDDIFISGTDNNAGALRQENNVNTLTGTLTLDTNALLFANGGSLTLEGRLVGPHTLTKTGGGTLVLTQDSLVDAFDLQGGTVRIQTINGLGATTNLVLNKTQSLELDGGLTLDASSNLTRIEMNGGKITSFNGLNTLDFPIELGPFASVGLGGPGDLHVTHPIGNGDDPVVAPDQNGFTHFGFHMNVEAELDLDNNGGLFNGGVPPTRNDYFGFNLFTDGPNGQGLDFNNDQDFIDSGAVGQIDNYANLWLGYLNIKPGMAGTWALRTATQDDAAGIWIDLNTNGVFESDTPGLGSNRGEQLSFRDGGEKLVMLDEGRYLIAFTHREGGGNSHVDFRYRDATKVALGHPEVIIKPTDPNQDGLWTPYAELFPDNSLVKTGDGTLTLAAANNFNRGARLEGGAVIASSPKTLGLPGGPLTLSGGTLVLTSNITLNVGTVQVEKGPGNGWDGIIQNRDGDNQLVATNLVIAPFFADDTTITAEAGSLILDAPSIDLKNSNLLFDGDGAIAFHPDIHSSSFGSTNLSLMQASLYNGNATRLPGAVPTLATKFFSQEAWFPNEIDWVNFWGDDIIGLNNPNPFDPNNYGNSLLGDLTIDGVGTANVRFMHTAADDANRIRIDLNQNGLFEGGDEDPYAGDRGGTFTSGTIQVPRGTPVPVLLQHREGGGGSRLQPEISLDDGATWQRIVPGQMTGARMTTTFVAEAAVIKRGSGTTTLSGTNTHLGETRVLGGTLLITSDAALGDTLSGTHTDGGTLAFAGPITIDSGESLHIGGTGALGMPGALVNLSGDSIIDAPSTLVAPSNAKVMGIGVVEGSLTIHPDIDLVFAALQVDGPGDLILNGDIDGLGLGASMPAYASRVLADHPLVYYQMNEEEGSTVANSGTTGSANNGSIPDPPSTPLDVASQNPALGSAVFFNNSPETGITTPFSMNGLDNQFTVEAWVFPSGPQDNRSGIAGQNDAYEFGMANGTNMEMWNRNAAAFQAPYPTDEWFHLAVTGDGINRRIYINAVEVAVNPNTLADYGDSTFFFNIGGQGIQDASNNAFDGSIDEVAVYDQALSQASLQEHYDAREATEGNNAVIKRGTGTLSLNGNNLYDAGTLVEEGVLGGTGTLDSMLLVGSLGTLNPGSSPGTLTVNADVVFTNRTAAYWVEVDGAVTAGTDYDSLAAGPLSLNASTLILVKDPGYVPTPGEQLVIATSSAPITDSFNGLPEGAVVSASGSAFTISYLGNQVTLTATGGLRVYAGPDTLVRPANKLIRVPVSQLLANDLAGTGPGPLAITSVPEFTMQNGFVNVSDGLLIYNPTNGYEGLDRFTYTVSDGASSATGLVTVITSDPISTEPGIADLSRTRILPNGDFQMVFFGSPNGIYDLDLSTDLLAQPIVWQVLFTEVASAAGEVFFTYPTGNVANRKLYFRIRVNEGDTD